MPVEASAVSGDTLCRAVGRWSGPRSLDYWALDMMNGLDADSILSSAMYAPCCLFSNSNPSSSGYHVRLRGLPLLFKLFIFCEHALFSLRPAIPNLGFFPCNVYLTWTIYFTWGNDQIKLDSYAVRDSHVSWYMLVASGVRTMPSPTRFLDWLKLRFH